MFERPPVFTEEKLKEILHYTDSPDNPSYEAFKSDSYYEIQSGAKGVSKSYSGAIISIFRLVNEKIFCSLWCRNQYSHIKTTLRPMFENVLTFLKEEHNLDYMPYIKIFDSGVYWDYDDGGQGRAIYFENFEKIQAFQGKTLKSTKFRYGELVIDEPIEDPEDSKMLPHELKKLYELQEKKLPLLIANSVERLKSPDNFKLKIKFFYNIFTTDHFLIQKYHRQVIPFVNERDELNEEVLNELLDKKYVKVEDKEFKKGLGINVIMYSKFFIPREKISKQQMVSYENLREENYRLWLITIAGFAFNEENNRPNYFMRDLLFDSNGEISKKVKIINRNRFIELLESNKIKGIYDGYDPGLSDNASWVRIALTDEGTIIVLTVVNDLKEYLNINKSNKNQIRTNTNMLLTDLIRENNDSIIEVLENSDISREEYDNFNSYLFTDNDIICEWLNLTFQQKEVNAVALMADRIDSKRKGFGILSRQQWQRNIFQNGLIEFIEGTEQIIKNLSFQLILPGEQKRDETIHREIYDLINAFEMSATIAYKQQYAILGGQDE